MWRNIKYYVLAFVIILVGSLASTALQLVESSLPVGHPASTLAANLSGVTIGGIIMVIGFLRDSRLEEERRRAEEAQKLAKEAQEAAEAQRSRAKEAQEAAEAQRSRAEAAEARIEQEREEARMGREEARQEREEARQGREEARQERERVNRYLEELIRMNQHYLSTTESLVQEIRDRNSNNGRSEQDDR